MIPRSKPIPRKRKKARPGRLRDAYMEQLRRDAFECDNYRCQQEHSRTLPDGTITKWQRNKPVTWETGELAHRKGKRMHGDSIDNVFTSCKACHRLFHERGPSLQKIVPAKGA